MGVGGFGSLLGCELGMDVGLKGKSRWMLEKLLGSR